MGEANDHRHMEFAGPMVKTPGFHCRGQGLIPGLGTRTLHAILVGPLLLLLLLSRFSRVRLCATPETAAHEVLLNCGVGEDS